MRDYKEDLNKIKLSKEVCNSLWFCISDFRNIEINLDFYYEVYKDLRKELGVEVDKVIESELRSVLTTDAYLDTFEKYFNKDSNYCKFTIIEVFFNKLIMYILYDVLSDIKYFFPNLEVSNDIEFDNFNYAFNNYGQRVSFEIFNDLIIKVDEAIYNINRILSKIKLKYALINKAGIKELPKKVSDFVKIYKKIEDDDYIISFIRKTETYTFEYLVEPVINLTNNLSYKSANKEFLRGLDSFKKGNYIDCVNGVTSSLESTIKIICYYKGYKFKGNEQLSDLTDILFKKIPYYKSVR